MQEDKSCPTFANATITETTSSAQVKHHISYFQMSKATSEKMNLTQETPP